MEKKPDKTKVNIRVSQNSFFLKKSVDPHNYFQNYRPIFPLGQALLVFNGNFNGKMTILGWAILMIDVLRIARGQF